jgi:hypothetical protein
MLFADDQILLARSEDDLQYSVHNLNKTASEFSMEINVMELWLFEGWNQLEVRYALIIIHSNHKIILIIWDTTYPMKERKILKQKLQILSKY